MTTYLGGMSISTSRLPGGLRCAVPNLGAREAPRGQPRLRRWRPGASLATVLFLAACGELAHYSLGGTLAGLAPGASVTLVNRGDDPLVLPANGPFRFTHQVREGGSYAVTVASQTAGQHCSVADGTGTGSGVVADVDTVRVVCDPP